MKNMKSFHFKKKYFMTLKIKYENGYGKLRAQRK